MPRGRWPGRIPVPASSPTGFNGVKTQLQPACTRYPEDFPPVQVKLAGCCGMQYYSTGVQYEIENDPGKFNRKLYPRWRVLRGGSADPEGGCRSARTPAGLPVGPGPAGSIGSDRRLTLLWPRLITASTDVAPAHYSAIRQRALPLAEGTDGGDNL